MAGLISQQTPPVNLSDVAKKYPALAPHLKNAIVQWGDGPGILEFYHPSDGDNPNKGKITLQFRDRSTPPEQRGDFAAADMLHYLGSNAPNGTPIDQTYAQLREKMMQARTPGQIRADQENYVREQKQFGASEVGTFDQYMSGNRSDSYMRGATFPGINPEWKGYLTPAQTAIGEEARGYLAGNARTVATLGTPVPTPTARPALPPPSQGGLLQPPPR